MKVIIKPKITPLSYFVKLIDISKKACVRTFMSLYVGEEKHHRDVFLRRRFVGDRNSFLAIFESAFSELRVLTHRLNHPLDGSVWRPRRIRITPRVAFSKDPNEHGNGQRAGMARRMLKRLYYDCYDFW